MSEHSETGLNMRCPICLQREIDVVLRENNGTMSCPKCSFVGSREAVWDRYQSIRGRFAWRGRRLSLAEQLAL